MLKAPQKQVLLLDGAPWTFQFDHGALWELCQQTGFSDPLKWLEEAEKAKWATSYLWDLAWALSWREREHRPGLRFVQFLGLLPVAEGWIPWRNELVKLVFAGLPPKQEGAGPANPPDPQPAGTGETGSTRQP